MAKKIVMSTTPKASAPMPVAADQWVENRTTEEGTKRLTLDLPESLHRRIKAQCAMKGVKMVEEIRRLLEDNFPDASV